LGEHVMKRHDKIPGVYIEHIELTEYINRVLASH
jgi:hypothetical protein